MWRGFLKIVGQDNFSANNVLYVAELNYLQLKWGCKYALVLKAEFLKNYY